MAVRTFVAIIIAALPLALFAGGIGTFKTQKDTIILEYDGALMRLQSQEPRNAYLIARDDRLYAVSSAAGKPLVLEGSAVLTVLGAFGGQRQVATGSDDIQRFVDLKATKRSETVAGVRGTIHQLTYVDRAGRSRTEEMVLTTDPRIAELTRNVGQIAAAFQRDAGVDNAGARELLQALETRGLGLLRYADKFQLVSLDSTTPDASRFALPAAPMRLPDLQGLSSILSGLGGERR